MTNTSEITVLSQNILLDKTRESQKEILPQKDRIQTIARGVLNLPYRPDIIGIQEAHITNTFHNGDDLAALCGYETGSWENHNLKADPPKGNQGRKHEYIGLFGPAVGETTTIDLGDNRKTLLTEVGGIAFATLHFRAGGVSALLDRFKNARNLIAALDEYDDAVIFGDFNEPQMGILALGRDALARAGFRSVFRLLGESSPKTFPTPSYQQLDERQVRWALDDILIRGSRLRPLDAGTIEYPLQSISSKYPPTPLDATDHDGVWARLAISP